MNYDNKELDIQQQITELQNQLSDTGKLFRSMLDNSPVAIMIVDSEGKMLYANHAFTFQKSDALIGRKIFEFIPPGDQPKVKGALDRVFNTGERSTYKIRKYSG